MFKELLEGRLLGHPVHPMLVHFPTALFTSGFLFDITGLLLDEPRLYAASFYGILLGLAGGVTAGLFGLIDLVKLGDRPKAFRTAGWHAGIQFVVLMVFGAIAGIKYQAYPAVEGPGMLQLSVMGTTLAAMLAGNYLGGELVFTHRVGMDHSRREGREVSGD